MPNPALAPTFERPEVTKLLKSLQESTRANPTRDPKSYVPVAGSEIANANYHHFIFGQRGAGKSSLLRHLESETSSENRITAWVDQEIFTSLSYPDVLVSAVLVIFESTLNAVEKILPSVTLSWWQRLLVKIKLRDSKDYDPQLIQALSSVVEELQKLKFAPIDRKIEWTVSETKERSKHFGGQASVPTLATAGNLGIGSSRTTASASKETIEGTKDQFLERALTVYRELLIQAAEKTKGGFIFVDDLYQVRRSDQALVLGYLHRLVKDTQLWLKIGSIRYSTESFVNGDPPRGMEAGHDAHEIALDRGMRYFRETQIFLEKIMDGLCDRINVNFRELFTEDARKRLVLAGGGVARDYLRIASAAILEARNRGVSPKSGSDRVTVEDVNKGAGSVASSKFEDLTKDEPSESSSLSILVQDLTEFCRKTKCAYFLVSASDKELSSQMNKLHHLRFTHLLAESETIRERGSQRFNVWLLDVANLSAQRATVGMDFLGWEDRSKRRNRRLVYTAGSGGQKPVEE